MACLIFITCPNERIAERISESLLKKKLVACVNMVPKIKSVYWWEGKIERSRETLLLIKTKDELFNPVKKEVIKLHPYEVPEVVCVKIRKGHEKYLNWIKEATK
jgi:periplasmic divalent cation tolerance protein